MNKIFFILSITAMVSVISITTHAQFSIGGPGTNGSTTNANGTKANGTNNSPAVPFDGGMSLVLIATGIRIGVKSLKRKASTAITNH